MTTFRDMEIGERIVAALDENGFEKAFPIQEAAIPILLSGRDVIGQAHTGTGKTAAYSIAMLEKIQPKSGIQGLVIAPTRELAIQISVEIEKFAKYTHLHAIAIYGGQGMGQQLDAIKRGVEILVATPGRLIDHLKRGSVNLDKLSYVVLDEADTMLDMGFIDDIQFIMDLTPEDKIVSLFSATMPVEILRLAEDYLRNPKQFLLDSDDLSGEGIDQSFLILRDREKMDHLVDFIKKNGTMQSIVFCSTKYRTRDVVYALHKMGFDAVAIEGDMSQHRREQSMSKFRSGKADILVATDVAARGIDVPHVALVVNYDVPNQEMIYFHRIGRTARAGAKGKAITLVSYSSAPDFEVIKRKVKTEMTDLNKEMGIKVDIPDPLKRQVSRGGFRHGGGQGGRRSDRGNFRRGGGRFDRGGPRRDGGRFNRGSFERDGDKSRGRFDRGGPRRDGGRSGGQFNRGSFERDGDKSRGRFDRGSPRRDGGRSGGQFNRGSFERDGDKSRGRFDRGGPRRDGGRSGGQFNRGSFERDGDKSRGRFDRGGPRRDGGRTGAILGRAFTTVSNTGGSATFTNLVESGDNGNATFFITVTNSSGNQITITQDDITDDSFVTLDTIKPVITLTGDVVITIFQNDPYVEPGSSIFDSGNPTYAGTVSPSPTSIDTSILGVQNITYTGTADAAGNTPDAVNRTITIQAKPLGVISLTIQSDNANNTYAKLGDQITATLTVNGTIGSVTLAEIESSIATSSIANDTITINKTVTSSDADTNSASFTITVTNEDDTTSSTFTNADLTGLPLVIDQTAPIITLNGDVAITILQNDPYVEPGSSVSDSGNPTYTGTVSATLLDTSILGIQNITYTGTADAAGNTPDAVNRTITIQAKPLGVTSLTIQSDNANNAYAKLGDQITVTLTVNGTIGTVTLAEIESSTPTSSIANDTITINKTVTSSDADTNSASFTITVTNEDDTTSSTFTNADLTGLPLVIDQTAPIITLNGDDNIVVIQNSTYTDAGAIATDASYGTQTVTSTDTIDTSIIGIYTLSYKAPDDPAGNLGPSITRTVNVQDYPPIEITSLTFTSDNTNSVYAKTGDTLTAQLIVNDTIVNNTIDILQSGLAPSTITQSGNQLDFTYTIPEISIESNATFNITVTNSNGVNKSITQEDVTSGLPIFVDTISPRITLNDSANYTIIQNTTDIVIPDATVNDGDPNYSGNYTVTPNGTLDTSTIGSVVLYTYTADADTAGNLGESTTLTVTVVDAEPITVTGLTVASSNGNNYARAGQAITIALITDGTDLGNVTGTILSRNLTSTSINDGSATFTGIVESRDNGNATFSITVTNSSRNQITITQDDTTDDTYVTIDTIKPVITLINPNDNTIRLGATYVDPGATVVDASYDGNQTIYSNNSVNTNVAGNYTLSYTVSDLAGNTQNITRNVTVIDLSINITSLTINSDNDNSSYAKAGDTLTIHLSVNDTITSNTVDILLDQDISATVTNDTLTAFTTVPTSAVENNATFSINITNSLGVPRAITQDDLTSSNVFVDTIAPRITLSNPIPFIAQNDSIPDADAIALDGDPNYNYTIPTPIGSIDNTTIGVYFRTYTPNPDNAGNPGENATQRVVVTASNGTVYLNTSVINNSDQHFDRCSYDVLIRVIIFENTLDHNNTLRLCASMIELDLSNVDTISGENTIVPHEYNYELQVSSRITVHILKSTTMTSITDDTDSSNFTIAHSIDEYRDTTVQIGSDNARYTLTNSAIGITFENIPASYKPYIRHTTNGPYEEILGYYGDQITNGKDALAKINANSTFNDALYQYNPSSKTGTVWTLHLSQVKTNSTSSSSDESSSNGAPTIGKTSKGARLVTNGFQYNDLIVDAERYHTELPLLGTNVGEINTIKIKVYDGTGPEGIKRVEFALGVPDIGLYHSAEAFIEVWMEKDTLSVKEIIIEDDLNILENSDISATVSQTSCSGDQTQCLLLELQYSYREPPVYNTIAIKPVDRDNDAYQFYFNDGIHVDGDSINLPKEMQISTSHAINHIHTNGTLHLIQTDRAENMWIDQYGFQWKIIGNTIRQITMPEYIVPTDNKAGILHGPDRNHPDFELTKYAEQLRAQATLAEMLGKSTILKPYPEHGGTIYFNATDRDGEAFKLLLELETERMEQIASLLYENDQ
ncbi:MAG: DEAD-box helicase [Cenarchaeum symbiont of Oopsacas minuta]|nr:DEAD-box helicase [Cenarchaeum symbiont of Oopsacas minuta]